MRSKGMWRRTLAFAIATILAFGGMNIGVSPMVVQAAEEANLVENGNFEADWEAADWNKVGAVQWTIKQEDSYNNSTQYFNHQNTTDAVQEFSISKDVTITEAGTYTATMQIAGNKAEDSGLDFTVGSQSVGLTGIDGDANGWQTFTIEDIALEADSSVTVSVAGSVAAGYWFAIDNITLTKNAAENIPDADVSDGDGNDVTDGDVTDGDVTGGDVTDGDVTDGDVSEDDGDADNQTDTILKDADFTGNLWNDGIWTLSPSTWDNTDFKYFTYADDQYIIPGENQGTTGFKFWMQDAGSFTLLQTVEELPAGTYTLSADFMGADADVQLVIGEQTGEKWSFVGYNAWTEATDTFTVASDMEAVVIGFKVTVKAGGYGYLDSISIEKEKEITLADADFTGDLWNDGIWTLSPSTWDNTDFKYFTYADDQYIIPGENQGTTGFKFWMQDAGSFTLLQTVEELPAGTYTLSADFMGADADVQLVIGEQTGEKWSFAGYNTWTEATDTFTIASDMEAVTVGFKVTVKAGGYGYLDSISIAKGGEVEDKVEPVDAEIYVERVKNLSEDFIGGLDISSYCVLKDSGVKFYDFEGNELDDQGFFNLLAECGVNYIRVRVWNDPYDSEGNGYGGGNNDIEIAKKIGLWTTNAGMKLLVDFHYSDCWSDPAKQRAPKAWAGYTVDQTAEAVKQFTIDSLNTLLEAGVDVGMVQVGNETNNGIAGVTGWDNMGKVFKAGAEGVHAVEAAHDKEIMVAVHFANPEKGNYGSYAAQLESAGVDYDVFASSYYPYWHGTLANLNAQLSNIAETYGKKVMVAETSWAYTLEDGDGNDNTVRVGNNDGDFGYDFNIHGQALELRSVINEIANTTNGIGVFYWEPAWLPVQVYDADADNAAEVLASNKIAWEKYGSGWASSYAGEYGADERDWYGGAVVENQALFDFTGHPLATLNIFNYVKTGTNATIGISTVKNATAECTLGNSPVMPEKVTVTLTDGTSSTVSVVWDTEAVDAAVAAGIGTYTITGVAVYEGTEYNTTCTLTINPENLLSNPSFEDGDAEWEFVKAESWTDTSGKNRGTVEISGDDPRTGSKSLHFYYGQDFTYQVEQTITLDAGCYAFTGYVQGGDAGDNAVFRIYAVDGDETLTADTSVSGWKNWASPIVKNINIEEDGTTITVGVYAEVGAGGWGCWDDFYLYRTGDASVTPDPDDSDDDDSSDSSSADDTVIDWSDVQTEVQTSTAATTTQSAGVNLNYTSTGETKVPTAVLDEIKGDNVTVAFQSGNGVALSISGQKLNGVDTSKLQSVDLTVTHEPNVIPDVAVASKAAVAKKELSIKDTGSFGVAVDMHINVGKENAGKVANLYRYNPTSGKLEFCSHFVITAEGQSMFAIGRGGDYLITVTNTTVNETAWYFGGDYTVQAGDNLSKIAVRYHMPLAELIRRNPQLANLNMIRPGQKLNVN